MNEYTFETIDGKQYAYRADSVTEAMAQFKEKHPYDEFTLVASRNFKRTVRS